jgi:hypothetical protein
MTTHDDALGPVNYVLVEFPGGHVAADGFQQLIEFVDAGTIAVLDLEFFSITELNELRALNAAEVGASVGIDLSDFEGASSELIGDDDKTIIAERASAGSTVAVLVYEDVFFAPVLAAWEHAGAAVLAEGPILSDDLLDALDETEK